MIYPKFTQSVGVAPGTATVRLDGALPFPERSQRYWPNPLQKFEGRLPLGDILPGATLPTSARIRWDIIGVVGGGSLIIAMAIGLVASALSK